MTLVESDALRIFGVGVSGGISYDHPGYWTGRAPAIITSEVRELTPQYLALAPVDRRRVDTAILRLGFAAARLQPSDAIVDLAIAIEAILSDKGNKDELTYRLRLRAALILGTELEERQRIKQFIRDLYNERSSVVHGEAPRNTDAELRSSGEQMVVTLVRTILRLGRVPDWSVVELTGGTKIA